MKTTVAFGSAKLETFEEIKQDAIDQTDGTIIEREIEIYENSLMERFRERVKYYVSICTKEDMEREKLLRDDLLDINYALLWAVERASLVINIDADENGEFPNIAGKSFLDLIAEDYAAMVSDGVDMPLSKFMTTYYADVCLDAVTALFKEKGLTLPDQD